jgi:hypothetical protein
MITECVEKEKKKKGISRGQLVRASYPFFVICALCLAHVHLQFAQVDLRMQQSQLQAQRSVLLRQEQTLARQNEALCDPESLKIHARRTLGMQEVEVQTADIFAHIPSDIQKRYEMPLTPKETDVMIAELRRDRQQPGLQDVLLSLLDGGRAIASTAPGNM